MLPSPSLPFYSTIHLLPLLPLPPSPSPPSLLHLLPPPPPSLLPHSSSFTPPPSSLPSSLSFLPPSSMFQSGYHECAELIIHRYPKTVDHVVQLTVQDTTPEPKVLSFLESLCKSNAVVLAAIVGELAHWASTAGMELLRCACISYLHVSSHPRGSIEGMAGTTNAVPLFIVVWHHCTTL